MSALLSAADEADALEQLAMRADDDADAALMAEFIRGSQRSILR